MKGLQLVIYWILTALISFGVVCLGVLFFAIQFGFEWSWMLCLCVWIALLTAKWLFSKD